MQAACAVSWCVCLARLDGVKCVVHAEQNDLFRPIVLEAGDVLTDVAALGDCDDCEGDGVCDVCAGRGEHDCEDYRCRHAHRCGACGGDGKCYGCKGSGWTRHGSIVAFRRKITKQDAEYLRFAFDVGLKELPPVFETPWQTRA